MRILGLLFTLCIGISAQDTTAVLEGQVTDESGGVIAGAAVQAVNARTGYRRIQNTTSTGAYHFALPVGEYELQLTMAGFAQHVHSAIQLNVSQTARIDIQLRVAREKDTVNVTADATLVDTGSNVIGDVVTGRQLVELPLNGRNFTQLGLLQPGVAPMTQGLAKAGGSLRAGQAYAVNGQRPESMYTFWTEWPT